RKSLEDAIERAKDQRAQLQGQVEAAEAQKAFIDTLAKSPLPQPLAGASAGPLPDFDKLFAFIGQRRAEAQKAVLDTQLKVREVDRQI
ncbi:hypothetical protein ACO1LG_13720, partial [Staphylococcus aureus]